MKHKSLFIMKRDGARKSIWQTEAAYIPQSNPDTNTVYDTK